MNTQRTIMKRCLSNNFNMKKLTSAENPGHITIHFEEFNQLRFEINALVN